MMRWLLFCALLLAAGSVRADELRPGYVEFTEQARGEWRLVWKAPVQPGVTAATQPVLPANCRLVGTPERALALRAVVMRAAARCSGGVNGRTIGLSNFAAAQSDALVRVQPLQSPLYVLRVTAEQPMAAIPQPAAGAQVASTYFLIGVDHIMFGFDHLLFVIALVLLLRGMGTIAIAVTAFTVAHSITLVGTTLGMMGLPGAPVEATIALSILFLAREIVVREPGAPRLSERMPWLVAFLFGLLHGFGFAGALGEIGLPQNDVALALLAFNLGVEAGQLAVVLVTAGLLAIARRWSQAFAMRVNYWAAYPIGITAGWWLIDRIV